MNRIRLLLVLASVTPGALFAQERFGTFLDWGTVQITLTPTPHHGIRLALGSTAEARPTTAGGLRAGFDPEGIHRWLAEARAVTEPREGPQSPASALVTSPLVSLDGDSIRLLRSTRDREWAPRIRVLLDGSGRWGRRFDILALPREVEALMAALQREAGFSGWDVDSIQASVERRARAIADTALIAELDAPPSVRRTGRPYYPDRSVRGRVVLEFVVDTAGVVDTTSFRTIYSADLRLIEWGQVIIGRTEYRPAVLRGRPVNVLVVQAVNFNP
jgi:hypothetical protein